MGYRRKLRSKWVHCPIDLAEGEDPADGDSGLSARIRTHLTFGQIDDIPLKDGTKYLELEEAIAPYVLEWTVEAPNAETGEWEPVPAPADAGVDAFQFITGVELVWLASQLRMSALGEIDDADLKKSKSTPGSKNSKP